MPVFRSFALILLVVPHLFGTTLSLDTAIKQFLEHNYDLQIAAHETQKSHANLITAKEHPNPTLLGSYEFMDIKHNFSDKARGSNAQATLILFHPFETAHKRDRRIELATGSIGYARLIYDETVRGQLSTLINAYYTVLIDQSNLTNAQEHAKAYASIVAIAKTKLDHGFLSQIDYQKISLQQIDLIRENEASRLALVQDRETLASLLALASSDFDLAAPANVAIELPALETLLDSLSERPDCKAAKQNLAVAEASYKLEKANAVPNITVGAEYASFGPLHEPLAGVNFSIPLPVYDKNEGGIEKSRITALQASSQYDKTLRMAKTDLLQNYEALRSSLNIRHALSEGFDKVRELKEKQENLFALKALSVLELLEVQKNFHEYKKNLIRSTIEVYIASARLNLSSGLPLLDPKKY